MPSPPARSRLLFPGFVALLLNSAYLWAFADPTLWYFAQVALHPLLGLALSVGAARLLLARRWSPGRLGVAALAVSGVGLGLGVGVLTLGATTPYRLLVVAHVAISTVGAVLLLVALWLAAPRFGSRRLAWMARASMATATLAALAAAIVASGSDARWRAAHRIQNPTRVATSMEGEGAGPTSPFFPSSANTNVNGIIPATFFMTSETCARCHRDIYDQWNSSAHHFSSFNNQWYRKSIEYMQDVVGTQPSKWCAGCHDHAVFFNGRFDRPIKEQIDTPEAQAGLGCTSCHSITRVHSTMGQGDFEIEYPPLHDLAASEHPVLRRVHDALLYLAPEPHRNTFIKPFHREQTAEF